MISDEFDFYCEDDYDCSSIKCEIHNDKNLIQICCKEGNIVLL
jgi:hypothetical protein